MYMYNMQMQRHLVEVIAAKEGWLPVINSKETHAFLITIKMLYLLPLKYNYYFLILEEFEL